MKTYHDARRVFCLLFVFSALLSGCSVGTHTVVKDGDTVSVQLTCRMPDGKVLLSTQEAVDPSDRSPLYLPNKDKAPLRLIAGYGATDQGARGDLDVELERGAARSLTGMSPGETKRVTIMAEPVPGPDGKPRLLPMARVRQRPREQRYTREEYTRLFKKEPEVGSTVRLDPMIPYVITEVATTDVIVRGTAVTGTEVATPYGTGIIREKDDTTYEIELAIKEGTIIRTGPLLGRIVSVNNRMFTIDYTQPFAGEELSCDLTLLDVERPMSAEISRHAAATN
jgi:FKBP-type peptidyl-prolyl cis-trans isomerase 2